MTLSSFNFENPITSGDDCCSFSFKVLLVEDNPFLRKLFEQIFGRSFQISSASNVQDGWNLYLQQQPNIVFLDIYLPDGSGHELAQRIRAHDPSAHIVMVTSSDEPHDIKASLKNKVDGFLVKPFTKRSILTQIEGLSSKGTRLNSLSPNPLKFQFVFRNPALEEIFVPCV